MRDVARVAAIYDIHGNLPALEAVLGDVRRESVDLLVVGGDVIPGPMVVETLACLRAWEAPIAFIHGNGEREILALRAGAEPTTVPAPYGFAAPSTTSQRQRFEFARPTIHARTNSRRKTFFIRRAKPICSRHSSRRHFDEAVVHCPWTLHFPEVFDLRPPRMLYMVVEHYRDGDPRPVYARFREKGRMAPDGLRYVDSWVTTDLARCFQIMECEDPSLLDRWMAQWNDIVDFDVTPVVTSAQAAAQSDRDQLTERPTH